MKHMRRYRKLPTDEKLFNRLLDKVLHQLSWNYLWIWRFLFIWGWNGKKNTFSVAFYKADMETKVWSIGEY